MTNGDKREHEAEKTLDLLSGIGRVPASPFLAEKVMRKLAERGRAPAGMMSRGIRFAVAGFLALVILNVATLLGAGPRVGTRAALRTAAVDSLALEYRLTVKNYQDWE